MSSLWQYDQGHTCISLSHDHAENSKTAIKLRMYTFIQFEVKKKMNLNFNAVRMIHLVSNTVLNEDVGGEAVSEA